MKIKGIISIFVIQSLVFVPGTLNAKTTQSQPSNSSYLLNQYSKARSMGELLGNMSAHLPDELKKTLFTKLQEAKLLNRKPAKILKRGNKHIVNYRGTLTTVEFVSLNPARLKINNRIVTFEKSDSGEMIWNKVVSALPKQQQKVSLWSLFIGEAHAEPISITTAIILGSLAVSAIWAGWSLLNSENCDNVEKIAAVCKEHMDEFEQAFATLFSRDNQNMTATDAEREQAHKLINSLQGLSDDLEKRENNFQNLSAMCSSDNVDYDNCKKQISVIQRQLTSRFGNPSYTENQPLQAGTFQAQ